MAQPVDQKLLDKHNVKKHDRPWHLKFHLPKSRNSSPKSSPSTSRSASPLRKTKPIPLDFTKNIPMNVPYPPFVNVEGVPNFRDIGGFRCPKPSNVSSDVELEFSVRRGYVFRCSELSQISVKGTKTMTHDLGLKRLYDLRSEREAGNRLGQPDGIDCLSTPVFRRHDVTNEMAVQQLTWGTAPDEPADAGFSQGYVDWYRQILVYGSKYAYRMVFEHILYKPDEPVLYHCSAGKDRTGVLSALVLNLCGVDNDTVAWEYSLTVPGMGVWEEAVEQEMVGDSMLPIRSHGGMTREEAKRVCGSRASNMKKFLEVVLEGEFAGTANYLKNYCEFTDAEVETIHSHLVVPGEATVKVVDFPGYNELSQT